MKRNLLLALVAVVGFLLALEVVLRTTHLFNARVSWTQPDREIGWRFTPGREYWFFGENDHAIAGRINSMGWRDHEREVRKPPHTYRIAVIGDSYVEAFQVELDSTFVSIAERRLNASSAAAHPHYEVMNFGRSGMSQAEELLVLERNVFPCRPDAVLLLFTPQNDIADASPATPNDSPRPFFHLTADDSLVLDTGFTHSRSFRIKEMINPIKQRSALVSLITERYNTLRMVLRQRRMSTPRDAAPKTPHMTPELRMCTASPDSVFAGNYSLCKALIARMARECAARHVKFVLASVPLVYQSKMERQLRAVDATFDPEFFDRDLSALADSLSSGFIPLTGAFRAQAVASGHALHWAHWNYDGHRLAGRLVAAEFEDETAGGGAPHR